MSWKRFAIAGLLVFICFQALDFVIHTLIYGSTYESMKHLWRPDMMDKMWIMYVLTFLFSFLFVFIFTKGYENRGIMEGVRFGLIMGVFAGIMSMYQYVIYPLPAKLVLGWFFIGIVEFAVAGAIISAVYKPKTQG